jgi:methionyl-tRNA formyltransferase
MTEIMHFPHSSEGNDRNPASVLFFGRSKCEGTETALALLRKLNFDVTYVQSKGRGDSLPSEISNWSGDYIVCFRSLFIVPDALLSEARIAAINFHPAPPEYPGSGCLNFALYDGAGNYGVTAHIMNTEVDSGQILECRRFPILESDNVDSLLDRTHRLLNDLFCDFITKLATGGADFLQQCREESKSERWNGKARKISELDVLQTINTSVDEEELARIVRATYTQMFPPKIVLHGYEFLLKSPVRTKL